MYFSNTNTIRRIISLITVLFLMTALFAGCGKKDDVPETTEDTSLNLNLNLEPSTEPPATETEPQPTETEPVISEKSATVISQLNIRSAPSTSGSSVIGTLYAGDKVEVERREEVTGIQWAYISSPQTGWICMDFVEMDIPDASNNNTSTPAGSGYDVESNGTQPGGATAASQKGVVTANGGLIIRSESSTNGEVKGTYNKGDVITILETKNGWGRTNRGWVKMDYVNVTGNATGNNAGTTNVTGNGSTNVIFKGIVKASELNIRSSGSTTGTKVGSYTYGDRVEILEKSGSWGRTSQGWISLDYVYQDGTSGTKTANGTVTGNVLNIRSGPGTNYGTVGSLAKGETVKILEQFTYNGTTWGCISKGWISMDYVDTGDSGTTTVTSKTGTVNSDGLRIRSGAGTGYDVVGSLNSGDKVTITEEFTAGGTVWGKIGKGWISLDYVDLN